MAGGRQYEGETPDQRRQREWQEQLARDAAARKKREKADADAKAAKAKADADRLRRLAQNQGNPHPPRPQPQPLSILPGAWFQQWMDRVSTSKPKPGETPPKEPIRSDQPVDFRALQAQQTERATTARILNTSFPWPVSNPPITSTTGKPQPNQTLIAANPNVVSDVGMNLVQPTPTPTASPAPTTPAIPGQALTQARTPTPTPNPQPGPPRPQPQPQPGVELFRNSLRDNAQARLRRNQDRLNQVQGTYRNTQPNNSQWSDLRTLATQDQNLLRLEEKASKELSNLLIRQEAANSPLGRFLNQTPLGGALGLPKSAPENRFPTLKLLALPPEIADPKLRQRATELQEQIALLHGIRQEMRAVNPELSVIDTKLASQLPNTPENNARLFQQMSQGFDGMRRSMADLSEKVAQDPNKALLFDALVPQTLAGITDPKQKAQAEAWLKQQQELDRNIKLVTGVGSAIFTIGSFAAGPVGWGVKAAQTMAAMGSVLGAAGAIYEFPQLQTMDLAAIASANGGEKLTNQSPLEARGGLIMGYVNLAMAGLDGLQLAPSAVRQMMRVPGMARAAGTMTQQQVKVLMNSVGQIKGAVTEKTLNLIIAALRTPAAKRLTSRSAIMVTEGGQIRVRIPGAKPSAAEELADQIEASMKMQSNPNLPGKGNNTPGSGHGSGSTTPSGTSTRPRNVPEETFAQFPHAKNWQDVSPIIGRQAGDLPPGYRYRRINQGTPEERLVIDRPRRNILEMGKPNENVPLHIADDGTIQVGFSPGAKRVSLPTLMRANFERAYGKVRPGYWIHHIIPDELVRNNPMARLARRLGYNLDREENLIGLAGKDEWQALQRQGASRPPADGYSDAVGHWSSHPQYTRDVTARLNREFKALEQRYGNLDKALKDPKLKKQISQDVNKIMQDTEDHFRNLIERGAVQQKDGRMSWNEQLETQPIA